MLGSLQRPNATFLISDWRMLAPDYLTHMIDCISELVQFVRAKLFLPGINYSAENFLPKKETRNVICVPLLNLKWLRVSLKEATEKCYLCKATCSFQCVKRRCYRKFNVCVEGASGIICKNACQLVEKPRFQ